ncbi:MAG: hypothetical protein WAW00_02270 [Candidatus Moraniibacteriota bacterium]
MNIALKTVAKQVLNALNKAKKSLMLFLKQPPRVQSIASSIQWKNVRKDIGAFAKGAFATFATKSRTTVADLRSWLRENAVVHKGMSACGATYERLVVRGEYAKRDFIVLFVAAVLLGMAFKAVATDTITIGFEDYTLAPKGTLYDLNAMQKNLIENASVPVSGGAPAGMCSE